MGSQLTYYMGHIASVVRRFFHPAAVDEMLSAFLPLMNGTELDVCRVCVFTPLVTNS